MYNKQLQNLVHQVRDVVKAEFGVMDEAGMIIACSDEKRIGQSHPLAFKALYMEEDSIIEGGAAFLKICSGSRLEFVAFIESDQSENLSYLSLISINIKNIKAHYSERFDKSVFLKNLLTGDFLESDALMRLKDLHLPCNALRVVILIRTDKTKDIMVADVIQDMFPSKSKDFVITLDNENTALIKELKTADQKDIDKLTGTILDMLNTELISVYIGVGTVIDNILDLNKSFREAQTALMVGKIFENSKYIINYNKLGIGRLIYHVPVDFCDLFLKEIFRNETFESLDAETMFTIQKFFEYNLNVSEASRQLYIHRNTLIYRLDKIQKITGLDLRKFDDAIIFKIAMLVKKYLDDKKDRD